MGIQQIRDTLERHRLRLTRDLGQNFLVEDSMAERLARLAGIEPGDAVIEVGTGLGELTRALAKRAARVTTFEIDAGLVRALEQDALLPSNVDLVHADALEVDLSELAFRLSRECASGHVRVVANLPYSAASPILRRLLDLRGRLRDWSVMLQREFADRLIAEPGTRDYGSLTVLHRLTVHVSRELDLKPGCFFPAPRVDSTFLRIFPLEEPTLEPGELPEVERIVRALFNHRRKTIWNGLRGAGLPVSTNPDALKRALSAADIDPKIRAEKLPAETLLALARELNSSPRGAR